MTRREFFKVAGWSSLFTLTGIFTAIFGPQHGQVIRINGRILRIVRNDSGEAILPKRLVTVTNGVVVGYAVESRGPQRLAVTTERVATGDLTAVVVSGLADVDTGLRVWGG